MISYSDREKTILNIAQMLNGLPYSQAKEILNLAHEKILSALKVSFSEDDLKSQTTKTKEFLDNYFATDTTLNKSFYHAPFKTAGLSVLPKR